MYQLTNVNPQTRNGNRSRSGYLGHLVLFSNPPKPAQQGRTPKLHLDTLQRPPSRLGHVHDQHGDSEQRQAAKEEVGAKGRGGQEDGRDQRDEPVCELSS